MCAGGCGQAGLACGSTESSQGILAVLLLYRFFLMGYDSKRGLEILIHAHHGAVSALAGVRGTEQAGSAFPACCPEAAPQTALSRQYCHLW